MPELSMIVLVTDFGADGPYTGQLKAVLASKAPSIPVITLFSDIPAYDIKSAAYLLASYTQEFPANTVFLCVVDPGVGSDNRRPVILRVNNHWFVGPDNGLFNRVAKNGSDAQCWQITWSPDKLSATFHGRDLFAPVAACLARGGNPAGPIFTKAQCLNNNWPDDYPVVLYIDHFGNALTGIRAQRISDHEQILIAGEYLDYARTFADVGLGQLFWFRNSNGLIEIAANQGNVAVQLKLQTGDAVTVSAPRI